MREKHWKYKRKERNRKANIYEIEDEGSKKKEIH